MGLKDLFKSPRDIAKEEIVEVPWHVLAQMDQLDALVEESKNKPVAIFKHSTRCGISRGVLKMFERNYTLNDEQLKLYFLDLLKNREISNEIASRFWGSARKSAVVGAQGRKSGTPPIAPRDRCGAFDTVRIGIFLNLAQKVSMETAALKSNILEMMAKIDDNQLLQSLYEFLKSHQYSKSSKLWNSLSDLEKEQVFLAFEESEEPKNLIPFHKVLGK